MLGKVDVLWFDCILGRLNKKTFSATDKFACIIKELQF